MNGFKNPYQQPTMSVDMMDELLSILFAMLGLIVGWLAASQKAPSQVVRAEERLAAIEEGREAMTAQMENVATQVSRQNS